MRNNDLFRLLSFRSSFLPLLFPSSFVFQLFFSRFSLLSARRTIIKLYVHHHFSLPFSFLFHKHTEKELKWDHNGKYQQCQFTALIFSFHPHLHPLEMFPPFWYRIAMNWITSAWEGKHCRELIVSGDGDMREKASKLPLCRRKCFMF